MNIHISVLSHVLGLRALAAPLLLSCYSFRPPFFRAAELPPFHTLSYVKLRSFFVFQLVSRGQSRVSRSSANLSPEGAKQMPTPPASVNEPSRTPFPSTLAPPLQLLAPSPPSNCAFCGASRLQLLHSVHLPHPSHHPIDGSHLRTRLVVLGG